MLLGGYFAIFNSSDIIFKSKANHALVPIALCLLTVNSNVAHVQQFPFYDKIV